MLNDGLDEPCVGEPFEYDGDMIKHALAIAVGCLSVNSALAQGGARLTIVPTGPGGCFVPKISGDGRVVAGTVTSFDRWLCFRWSEAEGLIELPCQIPRGYCVVTGLSSDGRVAMGTCVEFETTTGVRWVGANEPERILPGWYPKYSEALATNADGTVVVGVWRNWPAVWREGVGVTSFEERQGEVAACTDDGSTLYGCSTQGVIFRVRGDEPPTWLDSLPLLQLERLFADAHHDRWTGAHKRLARRRPGVALV